MRKLLKYLRHYKAQSVLAPLFKLLEASFELIVPLVVSAIINEIDGGSKNAGYVVYACLILVALGVVGLISAVAAQYFAAKAAVGFSKELRHDLFDKMQTLSYADIDGLGTGKMITRMTSDVNQVQSGINLVLRLFMRSPFIVFGAMIMAFLINATAGGIFAVSIAVLCAVVFAIMLVSIPLYKKVQGNLDGVTVATRETLTGARVLRAFCKEESEIEQYNAKNAELTKSQLFVGKISALMNPLTYAIINAAIIVLLYSGAVKFDAGVLDRGQVVALYNYMSQILIELIKLANLIITVTKSFACAGRINEILEMQPSIKGGTRQTELKDALPPFIEYRNVAVNYSNSPVNALEGVSFQVERGETVGIIGGTGAGKTTLVNVLPHFYDVSQGEVLINGENVNTYGDERLREVCGIVPQKAVLFEGTVRDNMQWGKTDATDEEIAEAIKTAQAADVIKSKKNGLDEKVEQGGKNFSGGQRQRLTIARALVKKPQILILDDSASALDYATDARLRQSLKNLDYSPTVFIVSQRTSSIRHADKIIVLDGGKVAGVGTHDYLWKITKFTVKYTFHSIKRRAQMVKLSQKAILKRILKQLKNYKFLLACTIFFALVSVAGNLIVPIFFGQVIDLLVVGQAVDFAALTSKFIIIAAVIAVTCLAQWLMNAINNRITYGVVKDIREQAFSKLQRLPLSFIDSHSYGDIVGRNVADVDQFADGLLMGFTQLFTGVLTIAGTLGIMLAINWVIALIVFVITPLSLFVAKYIASKTYSLFKNTSEIRGEQTAFIDEMIGNLKIVKAFNREDENMEKFDGINERLTKASLKSIFYSSLTNPSTRFVNAVVYAAVALSGALMLVMDVSLPVAFSVGMLTSLLSYANQYTKPFNEISGVVTELQNAIACAGRIYEIIDEEPQVPDADGAVELQTVKGDVGFQGVYFSYSPDKELIRNLNLAVKAGQRIAIVGPTGCGKTTLINLLMRFYDVDAGKISVDGNDIREITRKSLRRNYGMVLQETWLKSGTVRENIAIGKPDATQEEIESAAKAAHAHNFIMQLPYGYDTVISEDGLSQGQKQLLCITRIMLCLPPMLILDEATSSIDTRTEQRIQKAFAKLMNGRTSFIVAHRLSTIKEADVILVMKDGNIIEQGNHEQLLAKGGFYAELYNSQFAI